MSRRNVALLLVLSAIWGSSFLFIKLGVDELEPSVVALGRLVVGAAILLPLAAGRGGLGILRPHLPVVATLGLLNTIASGGGTLGVLAKLSDTPSPADVNCKPATAQAASK